MLFLGVGTACAQQEAKEETKTCSEWVEAYADNAGTGDVKISEGDEEQVRILYCDYYYNEINHAPEGPMTEDEFLEHMEDRQQEIRDRLSGL